MFNRKKAERLGYIVSGFYCLLFTVVLLSAVQSGDAKAKVYTWVDANGKVHYSDKKQNAAAQDVSAKLKNSNTDSSHREVEKLKNLFPGETKIEQQQRQQQSEQGQKKQNKKEKYCRKLKRRYRDFQGRFHFVHKDGSTSDITETERKELLKKVEADLAKSCR